MIVESPNKIETLKNILGDEWEVIATVGHFRELSKKGKEGLGYDSETMELFWNVKKQEIKNSKVKLDSPAQIIEKIIKLANQSENIYLATDPDREGEAIAWHVSEIIDKKDLPKIKRITFNEISKESVLKAIKNTRQIDMDWIHSQFARRLVDRIVGFGMSHVTRTFIKTGHAGRVQSVALRYIYDRQKEKEAADKFITYRINTKIYNGKFDVVLREKYIDPKLVKTDIADKKNQDIADFIDLKSAQYVQSKLSDTFEIYRIEEPKIHSAEPSRPYKTSSLYTEAISRLGWSINEVKNIAQKLYEGIKLNNKHISLISYPRTDATRYSDEFIAKVKDFIVQNYGKQYYIDRDYKTSANAKNTQDAHESIRVIDPFLTPDKVKSAIDDKEFKLYKLIWCHSIASMMPNSKTESTRVRLINNDYKFYFSGSKLIYNGWKKAYENSSYLDEENSKELPKGIKVGDKIKCDYIEIKDKKWEGKPLLTEHALVKLLEENGIGRPSTFSMMASKPEKTGYVIKENGNSGGFITTERGKEHIEALKKYFTNIVTSLYTKDMEENLDKISEGEQDWKEYVKKTKKEFDKEKEYANKHMYKHKDKVIEGRVCPKCGGKLLEKFSFKSKKNFIGCENFPNCNYAEFPGQDPNHVHKPGEIMDEKCPVCGKNLIKRYTNKDNKPFIACTGYPKCRYHRPWGTTAEEAKKLKSEAKAKKIKKEKTK